jgi:hypothetical protein
VVGCLGCQTALLALEEEEDKFERLEEWLHVSGAQFPLLYMKRYSENYRGVHIRTNTPVRVAPCSRRRHLVVNAVLASTCRVVSQKETELMAIPQECLISVEMGEDCPIGVKVRRRCYGVAVSLPLLIACSPTPFCPSSDLPSPFPCPLLSHGVVSSQCRARRQW